MKARIYNPTKTAMQSGTNNTKDWVLEYEPATANFTEPLMGWTGQKDMSREIKLFFATREQAVAYADKHQIQYDIATPHKRKVKPKSYADNFRFDRPEDTHP